MTESESETTAPPRINWQDSNVPAGNAPPMARWPLIAGFVVLGLWFVFLIAMAVFRVVSTR
ncbi:MAG: hypothetical protein JXB13_17840 [Phycisphaerae bacterium]|nr:hypothetical protein [Phycisphaerae bacterium]